MHVNFSTRFVIILLFGGVLEVTSMTIIGSKAEILRELTSVSLGKELCLKDEAKKMHDVLDLLRCINGLTPDILHESILRLGKERIKSVSQRGNSYNQFISGYAGRQYNDLEQSYFSTNPYSSNYQGFFPPRRQSGYYISGSKYASASSLSELQDRDGASSRFFKALSSIFQYDDLQCVPRILCEAATGVIPGSETYKQASSFQDFGNNALLGLLTALDASESSPILTFAKAAIVGYASRGNPTTCYREYPKCPRNYDSLIHYLNNHKGGFFRFFRGLTEGYRPFSRTSYNEADAHHTGSEALQFDASSAHGDNHRSEKSFLVFPGDNNGGELENQASVNEMSKSFNRFFNLSSANNENHRRRFSFFPQEKRK